MRGQVSREDSPEESMIGQHAASKSPAKISLYDLAMAEQAQKQSGTNDPRQDQGRGESVAVRENPALEERFF